MQQNQSPLTTIRPKLGSKRSDEEQDSARLSILTIVKNIGIPMALILSILTTINMAPGAWRNTMHMLGIPACVFAANAYEGPYAFLKQDGKKWREINKNNKDVYEFSEIRREPDYILLKNLTVRYDRPKAMMVQLPPCGGMAQLTLRPLPPMKWADMYPVWRT